MSFQLVFIKIDGYICGKYELRFFATHPFGTETIKTKQTILRNEMAIEINAVTERSNCDSLFWSQNVANLLISKRLD